MPAVLHIIGGNDRGKQFELNKPENRIGRGTDQDVVLADIAVSRRHVTIVMEGQRFRLKDLGSGNGSLVNGQRIDTVLLNDGDQVEIGNTLMRFDHPPSRPAAPPPASMSAPHGYPPSYGGAGPGYPPSFGGAAPGYPPGYPPPPSYGGNSYPPPAYPPGYPPPSYGGAPPGYPPPGYAPPYDPHASPLGPGPVPPVGGGQPPSVPGLGSGTAPPGAGQLVGSPIGSASVQASSYHPPPSVPRGGFLASGASRLVVFGMMTLVSVAGLAVILSRTVFARPLVVASEAEEVYRQGLRLFAAGDYDLAKAKFLEAVAQAQDAPEPRRYARLCDAETQARGSLKNAERALVNHRYAEAVRALDAVEPTSVYYDQASRQRRETAPKAAAEIVDEARRIPQDGKEANTDDVRSRLKAALELDPNNPDALDMLARLRGGSPGGAALRPGTANPPPSGTTLAALHNDRDPAPVREPRVHNRHAIKEDPDESDPGPGKSGGRNTASAPADSKAALAAYKSRDFNGAAKLFMADSMSIKNEKQAVKVIEYANQVRQLAQLVDHATADEAKNAGQAVKEYDQARELDQKLGHGMHAAYFKQRMGGLAVQAAKASFGQGKYEEAYASAQAAQRSGADASSVLKQLDQKASELVSQGQGMQKSNLSGAKQAWRTVLHIVPSSSANYTKAYSLLNSAVSPKRDEDEE